MKCVKKEGRTVRVSTDGRGYEVALLCADEDVHSVVGGAALLADDIGWIAHQWISNGKIAKRGRPQ